MVGAWCPSLSPDGDQIAYVTDRSGPAPAGGRAPEPAGDRADPMPRQVSPPAPGGRLGRLVAGRAVAGVPGLAERTDPRRVARDAPGRQRCPGAGRERMTWQRFSPAAGRHCRTPMRSRWPTASDRMRCLPGRRRHRGEDPTVATGGFLAVTSVSGDGRRPSRRRRCSAASSGGREKDRCHLTARASGASHCGETRVQAKPSPASGDQATEATS